MKFIKFLTTVMFITALALVYIHLQMRIIDLAYQGKTKENKIRELINENNTISYSILSMKSANHIGDKMLDEDSDMRFVDPAQIVHVLTPDQIIEESYAEVQSNDQQKSNIFISLLSMGAQAEAKTQK